MRSSGIILWLIASTIRMTISGPNEFPIVAKGLEARCGIQCDGVGCCDEHWCTPTGASGTCDYGYCAQWAGCSGVGCCDTATCVWGANIGITCPASADCGDCPSCVGVPPGAGGC